MQAAVAGACGLRTGSCLFPIAPEKEQCKGAQWQGYPRHARLLKICLACFPGCPNSGNIWKDTERELKSL